MRSYVGIVKLKDLCRPFPRHNKILNRSVYPFVTLKFSTTLSAKMGLNLINQKVVVLVPTFKWPLSVPQ